METIQEDDFFSIREDSVAKVLRDYWITMDPLGSFSINDDGSIDVKGSVKFSEKMGFMTEIPLKFNKVSGDFLCNNLQLTSLKNCPRVIGGIFDCSYNPLQSLENAPKKVGTFVMDNMIKSLCTGGLSVNYENVMLLHRTNDPDDLVLPNKILQNARYLPIILGYQNYYSVYGEDGTGPFNESNFDELLEDVHLGLR